ncbi:MAG TPA: cytochrome c oxidase subunit 3 [Pyrinomonadaceae bacterium]|nr:cytochrome c oxidase subunit 3 [Pyrinomonadaceae bacterium]
MVTTVTANGETQTRAEAALDIATSRRRGGRSGGNGKGPNGGGPGGGGGPKDGDGRRRDWSPERYRIGVYVGLASILMMFTALASALIVRAGLPSSFDWRGGQMPSLVYLSTALIIASSFTFTLAKSALKKNAEGAYNLWLGLTLLLGLGFLASQFLAWRQLVAQGLYLASNPHSSFFYVLTGLHAVHILGGLIGLGYLFVFTRRGTGTDADAKRRTLTDVVGIYWHFMDLLWVFLFLLLFLWR